MPYSPFQLSSYYGRYLLHCLSDRKRLSKPTKNWLKNHILNRNTGINSGFVQALKSELRSDNQTLNYKDLGTGQMVRKKVSNVYQTSAKSRKYANLLFRLAQNQQAKYSVEIGTSLGLSSLYLSMANPNSQIITFEGAEPIADLAQRNFKRALKTNIKLIRGNFDQTLPDFLRGSPPIDLYFLDGNHYYEPTMRYFEWALNHAQPDTMLIFDDINWSKEMQRAWESVQNHASSILCIDLFFMGIVLLNDRHGSGNYSVYY